ncbi:uncharacterized protein [Diadema setosum]|uniref:uncharacterized protein isoform X2 n=1 Tax=Diadema setosum TaxID=31175 RepID=UPI003B3A3595
MKPRLLARKVYPSTWTVKERVGVQATGLTWEFQASNVIAGIENELQLISTVEFNPATADVTGSRLWRLGMYGSKNSDGSGEKFNYNSQTLNNNEMSMDLLNAGPLEFTEAIANFDILAIGCGPFEYVCVEFTKNDRADPPFSFSVYPEGDTIKSCQRSDCRADLRIVNVRDQVRSGTVLDGRYSNPYSMEVAITGQGVGVAGDGLWAMRAFGSSRMDGSGRRYSERTQVLTNDQQGQTLRVTEDMIFGDVEFDLNMQGLSCSEVQYVCVEFAKGEDPSTVFNLIPVPDPSVLVSCSPAECEGVQARGFQWRYTASNIIAGMENELDITSTVQFTPSSMDVTGSNLWRLGLYGSRNADGSGRRFNYNEQTLNNVEVSKSLLNAGPLEFTEARAMFDVAAIGCGPYTYACMEFTKNANADPDFSFTVIPDGADTIVSCQESPCQADLEIINVGNQVRSGTVLDGRYSNPYSMEVSIRGQGVGVAGDGLWAMRAFGSSRMDGSGRRYSERTQVLTNDQQGQTLRVTEDMIFGDVEFDLNMQGLSCSEVQYVCVEFAKGEDPSTVFNLIPVPDPSVLVSCSPAECEGVQVRGFQWRYTASDIIAGMENELDITSTVQFTPSSIDVTGSNLWRLGLYGSRNVDGSGRRFNYNEQTLNNVEVSKSLLNAGPLEFTEAKAMFDVAAIGCGPYTYACMEFTKNAKANPDFTLTVIPDGADTIVSCQESPCQADLEITNVGNRVRSGTVLDGRYSNPYSMEVSIRGQGVGVAGDGLWAMRAFGSSRMDGSGRRYSERTQVLTGDQQGQTLRTTEDMLFGSVDFDLNMQGLTCNQVQYVCVEFAKGENPTTVFNLIPVPNPNVLISCSPTECEGVFAEELDWNLEPVEPVYPGEETSVSIDSSVTFREGNRELVGSGLWRQGLYGSRNADGSGERFNYKRQTLSRPQAGTTLEADSPLEIADAVTDFEIGSVGCNDFGYVCLEFTGGDNPNPDYFFRAADATDNSPEANTLVKCKEQECLAKAIFTDLNADLGDQVIYENRNNPLTVDLTGITDEEATNVKGDDLWKVGVYGSRKPDGTGPKAGLVEQILDPQEAGTTLNDGENLPLENVDFDFDMSGIRCEDASYLCFDLDKNPRSSVDYIFEARPDDSVTTECIDMRDRCKGATAIDIDWTADVGDAPFGQPSPLTLTADVNFDPESPDVNGLGLWELGVFAAREPDGSGPRRDEIRQTLDPFNEAKPLEEGGPLEFDGIKTNFPIDELGCDDYRYLCVEFRKGQRPSPDFKFETATEGDTIISCKEQECRGVEVDSLTSSPTDVPTDLVLYEGKAENPIQYNSVATTTPDSGTVRGVDLWTLSQWGSERANGNGPRHNEQQQVLSGYHAALPVMEAGDTLNFEPLSTNFDMTGLRCPQVKYICNELSKDPQSRPDFEFTAVPNESVLRSCFEVPDGACKGVVFSDLDWEMDHGPVSADRPDDVRFNVDVDTLPESGAADGDGLWRIGVFGAQNPQGTGPRLDYKRQILTRGQSSTPAEGEGAPLELQNLETEFDLSQLGCDSEYRYLCLEFAKGLRASPDFEFEINGGGDVIISCKEQPCRRPVIINDVETNLLGNGRVNEGTRNNRILYDMTAIADSSSGKASGTNLWELTTFGSTFPDGRGQRYNPQTDYTFTQYQKNKAAYPGENIRYGPVDTNFDMTGLTCNEIRYFCSELRKGDYASPDFEMVANPTEDVLTDCFELNCEGVLIDNTRISLNSDDELTDGPNDLSFDFTVNSNPTGGDANGNNLWRLETFTSNNNDGSGRRDIIRTQTLDPADASRDLDSGNTIVFRNLQALVDSADVNCQEPYYLCAELTKNPAASSDFSMRGTREDATTSCKLMRCAKARKFSAFIMPFISLFG